MKFPSVRCWCAFCCRYCCISHSRRRCLLPFQMAELSRCVFLKSHQRLIYYYYMYNTSNQLQIASIINCRCLFPAFVRLFICLCFLSRRILSLFWVLLLPVLRCYRPNKQHRRLNDFPLLFFKRF